MKQILRGCAIVLLVAVSVSARSDSTLTITQIAEIEFDHHTVYLSVVADENQGQIAGRLLVANKETLQALTIMASDPDSLTTLRRAVDELIQELAHADSVRHRPPRD